MHFTFVMTTDTGWANAETAQRLVSIVQAASAECRDARRPQKVRVVFMFLSYHWMFVARIIAIGEWRRYQAIFVGSTARDLLT
jgi:hypothetical protein